MNPLGPVLFRLLLAAMPLAASAAADATKPWISAQAESIRERVNAARSSVEGWTANVATESVLITKAGTKTYNDHTTERYLRSEGLPGYYAATHRVRNDELVIVSCQDLGAWRFLRRDTNRLKGISGPPVESNRPDSWLKFDLAVKDADYLRWTGRETVAGQICDIVESIHLERQDPHDPQVVTEVKSRRFYVGPAGFIERIVVSVENRPREESYNSDERITYDAKAKLTPEDFSPASFERDAAVALRGEPMPKLEELLFAAGGTLPDMAFVGWSDGKLFRLSDFKGKVVVVETWTSWCHFCKEAFPTYEKMRKVLAEQEVVFVAVSFDEKLANYEKWMKQHGGDYGFKFGRVEAEDPKKAMKEFRGELPGFYVLGRDGKIVSSYLGYGYGRGNEDPRLLAALRAAGVKL